MTEQRIFPFFVNGQYWKKISVDERTVREGYCIQYAVTKLEEIKTTPAMMAERMAKMKKLYFQLARCGERKHNMVATWVQGFWICDDELYLEDGVLYLRS